MMTDVPPKQTKTVVFFPRIEKLQLEIRLKKSWCKAFEGGGDRDIILKLSFQDTRSRGLIGQITDSFHIYSKC